jgi:hypothetical protein
MTIYGGKLSKSLSTKKVFPGRGKCIDDNSFFQTFNSMWHIWRDVDPVAIVDDLFFFTHGKFKSPFGTIACLGMNMFVRCNYGACIKFYLDHHDLFIPAKNFS